MNILKFLSSKVILSRTLGSYLKHFKFVYMAHIKGKLIDETSQASIIIISSPILILLLTNQFSHSIYY